MDCANLDQTNVYLARSGTSPLEIRLREGEYASLGDPFLSTIPHIGRLKALTFTGSWNNILKLAEHFKYPAPLLRKLDIRVRAACTPRTEISIFKRDFSSLRELRLSKVLTDLPLQNLSNLTRLDFHRVPNITMTRLLSIFEHASLLRQIRLADSLPDSSDAPDERVVPLPHLELLRTHGRPAPSILLNHLHIPAGAFLILEFGFSGGSPLPGSLPTPLDNLGNISHITSVNLNFKSGMTMGLKGPSGALSVVGHWAAGGGPPPTLDHQILRSFNGFRTSTIENLMITQCVELDDPVTEGSSAGEAFSIMDNLRTLTLVDCGNLSFIRALDPNRNTSNTVVCPKLEELVLCIGWDREKESSVDRLLEMARERALRGARLPNLKIICPLESIPAEKAVDLRSCVSGVEYHYGPDYPFPEWCAVPDGIDEFVSEVDW